MAEAVCPHRATKGDTEVYDSVLQTPSIILLFSDTPHA